MPLPDEKFDTDAKRMKTRGFGGYLSDRARGKADFDAKTPGAKDSAASPMVGGKNSANKEALEAAGFKRGGKVQKTRW